MTEEEQLDLVVSINDAAKLATELSQFAIAQSLLEQSLQVSPMPFTYCAMGHNLMEQGKYYQATDLFKKAIQIDGECTGAYMGMSHALHRVGDILNGFILAERRLAHLWMPLRNIKPQWDGSDLKGRTLLLVGEGGYGDIIQMIRWAKVVKERGGEFMILCYKGLHSLFEQLGPKAVFDLGDRSIEDAQFDFYLPMLSLPLMMGVTKPSDIPNDQYLQPKPELVEVWNNRFINDGRKRVGIAWTGNPKYIKQNIRSIWFDDLRPLIENPLVQFHSLQVGGAQEIPLRYDFSKERVKVHAEQLTNFDETAALISNLDLVITVDTSIAHIAGALGKPAWTMLPFNSCWRWGGENENNYWYRSMKLFRQSNDRLWGPVIAKVNAALSTWAVLP